VSDDDWPSNWFRRGWWPFSGRWMLEDVDRFFKQMDEYMKSRFEEFSKKAPRDLIRTRTLPDGRKIDEWGPFVFGYSMTFDSKGSPHFRRFGNLEPKTSLGKTEVDVKEEREPLVDIVTTDSDIRVVAELPGVEKENIELYGTEDELTVCVNGGQRKYHKEIRLPAKVDVKRAKSSYKNGVLEICLPKKTDEKPKGEHIDIL